MPFFKLPAVRRFSGDFIFFKSELCAQPRRYLGRATPLDFRSVSLLFCDSRMQHMVKTCEKLDCHSHQPRKDQVMNRFMRRLYSDLLVEASISDFKGTRNHATNRVTWELGSFREFTALKTLHAPIARLLRYCLSRGILVLIDS